MGINITYFFVYFSSNSNSNELAATIKSLSDNEKIELVDAILSQLT